MFESFFSEIPFLLLWVYWVSIISWAAVFFVVTNYEARWVLGALLLQLVVLEFFTGTAEFPRLLALSHIVLWTPLVLYLLVRLPRLDFRLLSSFYLLLLTATYSVVLYADYQALLRWLDYTPLSA